MIEQQKLDTSGKTVADQCSDHYKVKPGSNSFEQHMRGGL